MLYDLKNNELSIEALEQGLVWLVISFWTQCWKFLFHRNTIGLMVAQNTKTVFKYNQFTIIVHCATDIFLTLTFLALF